MALAPIHTKIGDQPRRPHTSMIWCHAPSNSKLYPPATRTNDEVQIALITGNCSPQSWPAATSAIPAPISHSDFCCAASRSLFSSKPANTPSRQVPIAGRVLSCLLYTSDAADEEDSVD